jgi:hypothetical protein
MVYQYDLISGKVNQVAYQPGRVDGFYHRYSYDAENKLKEVYTSRDRLYWEREALYDYYRHGPLARTVLGQRQVQGVDYGYTLQGWLKGVNSHSRTLALYDMGQDGRPGLGHGNVARDVYGYSLNYHPGDYKAISSAVAPWAAGSMHNLVNTDGQTVAAPLYNGNIASMMVSIPQLGATQLYGYRYDQLNRIVSMDAFGGMNNDANSFVALATTDYTERVSYDPNGNILSYWRNGAAAASGTAMDKLTYQYPKDASGRPLNNRLRYVHDEVNSAYTEDIDSQTPLNLAQVQAEKLPEQAGDNYAYDAIGNLVKDTKEGIASITWNVYGKIAEIQRNGTAENPVTTIKYTYDASGNRIGKAVWKLGDVLPTNTYYVRDASGNVMGIYESGQSTGYNLTQKEVHLYGSSRLGILNTDVNVQGGNLLVNSQGLVTFTRGNKFFELSNHLANVLATISDKKIPVSGNGTTVAYYTADVATAGDCYPFGMAMPGRKYQATANSYYRYSINGQEKDKELNENSTTALYWEYDSRIARRWNRDPKPVNGVSPYACFMNNPIIHIDVLGDTGEPKGILGPLNLNSLKGKKETYGNSWFGWPTTFAKNTVTSAWNQSVSAVEDLPKNWSIIRNVFSKEGRQENRVYFMGVVFSALSKIGGKDVIRDYVFNVNTWEDITGALLLGRIGGEALPRYSLGNKYLRQIKADNIKVVVANTADDVNYLKSMGAKALYMPAENNTGYILLSKNSRIQLIEEAIHHSQRKTYGIEFAARNTARLECEAQDILYKIATREKWSINERLEILKAHTEWLRRYRDEILSQ